MHTPTSSSTAASSVIRSFPEIANITSARNGISGEVTERPSETTIQASLIGRDSRLRDMTCYSDIFEKRFFGILI
jgi:hypothetical protein